MRTGYMKAVLAPTQAYVCLSCRLQGSAITKARSARYQHTGPSENDGRITDSTPVSPGAAYRTRSGVTNFLQEILTTGPSHGTKQDAKLTKLKEDTKGSSLELSETVSTGADNRQAELQQKFLAQRRKQILALKADQDAKVAKKDGHNQESLPNRSKSRAKKTSLSLLTPSPREAQNPTRGNLALRPRKNAGRRELIRSVFNKSTSAKDESLSVSAGGRKAKSKNNHANTAIHKKDESAENMIESRQTVDNHSEQPTLTTEDSSNCSPGEAKEEKARETFAGEDALKIFMAQGETQNELTGEEQSNEIQHTGDGQGQSTSVTTTGKVKEHPGNTVSEESQTPATSKTKESDKTKNAKKTAARKGEILLTRARRKSEVASQLKSTRLNRDTTLKASEGDAVVRKCPAKDKPRIKFVRADFSKERTSSSEENGPLKRRKASGEISDIEGLESLQSALGGKKVKNKAPIENSSATELEMLPVPVDQPPVPGLSYGLERVLFNPGVYQLQDPRSRVYNFDPYLQKIMPVAEFDFNALKEYITSSKDESLKQIAKKHGKRYMGSTSSMTGVLAHFHFLLSQWRPIDTSMLSKTFPTPLKSFTELQRIPSAIFLRWKDGSYAIDADKEFASASVLSMLGKSLEKLLTLSTDDYERYRKSSSGQVTDEEQFAPEAYHYSTQGDFLMRSQLDAHDPRLPGTGMFDLKTRAVVSIRMDVSNYEHGLGYQIKSRQGEWESYEREYHDMIRAAFLKYSMQVRMGRMDGIFVAFHNVERIFGFQYISLPEMDSTIHGQWDTCIGDQEFKLSLDLLNKVLDKATKKFPETSLRIHFETRETQTPFMYIFAEPMMEEQVTQIQSQNDAKIREFEKSVLGLNHEDDSEAQDVEEEDSAWENIQADVQKAMDNDELSVDEPSADHVDQDDNAEETGNLSNIPAVFDDGSLSAGKDLPEEGSDADVGAAAYENEAIFEGQEEGRLMDEEGMDKIGSEVREESEDEGYRDEGEYEHGQKHNGEEKELDEQEIVTEDPIIDENDIAVLREDESEPGNQGDSQPCEQNTTSVGGESDTSAEENLETPAEEDPDFQTEADSSFLDAIDNQASTASESSPTEILAMTLTVRNKINGKFVLRPEQISAEDKWEIEYSLVEVPTQERAHALYQACITRRKKRLEAPTVPENEEIISYYLRNLRNLSMKGKEWREQQDNKDQERPMQVLGQDIYYKREEDSLDDQAPDP